MKIFFAVLVILVLFSMLIWTAYGTPFPVKCRTDRDCIMCGLGISCKNSYCERCTR
uniref:Venom toxin meuTx22 n=1 Tax=Mesobuthus eupeus TaxID=34648 RepID=A0A146CJ70_MESEU|nr:venom toxin meuTx22 [Mesobuthus eupeus]